MKSYRVSDMSKGWFVGDFEPSVFRTDRFEVGMKAYKQGDSEARHVHRVATEITVVLQGEIRMNGRTFKTGDIVVLDPGEPTDFCSVTDSTTLVVKTPCNKGDKYFL